MSFGELSGGKVIFFERKRFHTFSGNAESLESALNEVTSVLDTSHESGKAKTEIIQFLSLHPDALHRSCLSGHLTGSAAIVNESATKILIMLHKKLQIWIQPGGHADGDGNLARVALREAIEETGIEELEVLTPGIDCDVHIIPQRLNEPEHLHLDIRYLIRAPENSKIKRNHESVDMRWVEFSELMELTSDESTIRLAKVGLSLAQQHF